MRSIKQVKNLKGKKVLVRVDFNVPVQNGKVIDSFRIVRSLPTIKFLKQKGARIILLSHLGRDGASLAPAARVLNKLVKAKFVSDVLGEKAQAAIAGLKNGEIVLLENLRQMAGEQSGDLGFAKALAQYGDVYVNDAFAVSHRKDASVFVLPKMLPSYTGLLFNEEVTRLSRVFKNPKQPFLFILGGAKFYTKLPLIKKYVRLVDKIFIGGALAHDFFQAMGYEIGESLVSEGGHEIEKLVGNPKIILPQDVLVEKDGVLLNKKVTEISKGDNILDIGSNSAKELEEMISKARFILWNGPLGKYEKDGDKITKQILKKVAKSKAESILGGGDTVAIISKLKMENEFSFISTGGGATLDFLAHGTLPGIQALQK